VAIWSIALTVIIFAVGLVMGVIIQLPGGSSGVIVQGSVQVVLTAFMVMLVVPPFALIASVGRGYLLPLGVAVLIVMMSNFVALAGWGEFFPWVVPGLYAQGGKSLAPMSFWLVILTGLVGVYATYVWWKLADQNR
jgi:ABC-2 type transport system permease protein